MGETPGFNPAETGLEGLTPAEEARLKELEQDPSVVEFKRLNNPLSGEIFKQGDKGFDRLKELDQNPAVLEWRALVKKQPHSKGIFSELADRAKEK